jgi:hypothetical protein
MAPHARQNAERHTRHRYHLPPVISYLSGYTCLHADTYMGVKLPPKLSPNMYHHFRVQGGWPTADNPLFDFIRPELVSFIGQRYEIIPIDVHPDRPAPFADTLLQTVASASAKHHQQSTPRHFYQSIDTLAEPMYPRLMYLLLMSQLIRLLSTSISWIQRPFTWYSRPLSLCVANWYRHQAVPCSRPITLPYTRHRHLRTEAESIAIFHLLQPS